MFLERGKEWQGEYGVLTIWRWRKGERPGAREAVGEEEMGMWAAQGRQQVGRNEDEGQELAQSEQWQQTQGGDGAGGGRLRHCGQNPSSPSRTPGPSPF